MLDDEPTAENSTGATDAASATSEGSAAPPRRRRRAAARPAAPPAPVPDTASDAPATGDAPPVDTTAGGDEVAAAAPLGAVPVDEPPVEELEEVLAPVEDAGASDPGDPQDLPPTEAAGADAPAEELADQPAVPAEPPVRPRRRRAASRPAGAAAATLTDEASGRGEPALTDEASGRGEPALTDEASGRGEPALTDEASGRGAAGQDAQAAEPKAGSRRRRAARRPAAPPADTADTPDPSGTVDPVAETPDPSGGAPAAAAGTGDGTPARGRRRRRSRAGDADDLDAREASGPLASTGGRAAVEAVEDSPQATSSATEDGRAPTMAEAAPAGEATPSRVRPPVAVTFQPPVPADTAEEESARPRRRRASRAAAPATVDPSPPAEDSVDEVGGARDDEDALDDARDDQRPDDDSDGGRSRRRRRGRRGRGRARGPEDEETGTEAEAGDERAEGDSDDDSDDDDSDDETGDGSAAEDRDDEGARGDDDAADDAEGSSTRRRRRRRRRGGGDNGEAEPEPAPKERKEREPRERSRSRATAEDDDGVRGITGSTRMEAKRQRRREGRDSGRRRVPIVSEAEFLARRESVERVMLVRSHQDRTQVAVLEDGVLVEHYVTQGTSTSYAGNIYLGKVQNVLPSMEAAFIDIGKGRNGVLYAGEVNWDALGDGQPRRIESALKSGQDVLVQVSKDPIGHKGARLTSQISLPGRYLVYVPGSSMTGISRKLPDTERARLKAILKKVVPDDGGVIVRTAAEGASEPELTRDVERLVAQWKDIQAKAAKGKGPALLYGEPDLVVRVVRDVFNEDFTSLVVQGDGEWETVRQYVEWVAPDLAPRLSKHTGTGDLFADHRVDEQLAKALDRKVWLPSGGSLVIDRTEAMVVIDVNTGKFVGKGSNLEETVTKNNLEAAEEIVRQLRLRDLGGIIVIDFIDMVLESNRELVLRRLTECLGRDRTKHQVAEVTSLGLVQMTRKRVGQGLLEAFSEPCSHCNGRGIIVSTTPAGTGAGGNGSSTGGGRGPSRRGPIPAPPPGVPVATRAAVPAELDEDVEPVEVAAGAGEADLREAPAPDVEAAEAGARAVVELVVDGDEAASTGTAPAAPTDVDLALPAEPLVAAPTEPAVDAPSVAEEADVVEPATLTPTDADAAALQTSAEPAGEAAEPVVEAPPSAESPGEPEVADAKPKRRRRSTRAGGKRADGAAEPDGQTGDERSDGSGEVAEPVAGA